MTMQKIQGIIEMIENNSSDFEKLLDARYRKKTGSYYTSLELSMLMIEELIQKLSQEKQKKLYDLKFLEPCVGTGSFVFAYILTASKFNFTNEQYKTLLNNIYVCDINKNAIDVYKNTLGLIVQNMFGIILNDKYFEEHISSNGLLFNVNDAPPRYISLDSTFNKSNMANTFDIVATNPPYKILKAEMPHYDSAVEHQIDKNKYSDISNIASKKFAFSANGTLNLYKLFIEEIISNYTNNDASIALLVPSSILTTQTCNPLREYLLNTTAIKSIKTIAEKNRFINVNQALCAILLNKGMTSKEMEICTNIGEISENSVVTDINKIVHGKDKVFLLLNSDDYDLFKRMNTFPKIKELDFIVNMRGEFDLGIQNRQNITNDTTKYPLIRGRNIAPYQLLPSSDNEYVNEAFVANSNKKEYIGQQRLAGQQISNMSKTNRLIFALIPCNVVIGNSCNFLAVKENKHGIDLFFLLGILNSNVVNHYFKLQSSNNHISNYEIDSLPIPISHPKKKKLSLMVQKYTEDINNQTLLNKINTLVEEMFLSTALNNKTSFEDMVKTKTDEKTKKVLSGCVLNHTYSKLSDLDMEVIHAIPQGGNWKNLPEETMKKSGRLIRIAETGGRTTLYGRIDYEKPSYTITTLFNRPGCGTYIHPVHNRTITVREAARFQSFPDDYYFCGNQTNILKQVGNAVPPILAYQIAKNILQKTDCKTSLDLFSGAGGMFLGFKYAGVKSVLCTDIDKSACLTLKVNNPEIDVLCGDITQTEIKKTIIDKSNGVDIVCGGAPCQGFSMAGFRLDDDPRNRLFLDFIDVVKNISPKIVVFENVEGLLSFQKGAIYRCIHEMFSDMGYSSEGRILRTNFYGVPQKRKRVFVVCVRKNVGISPADIFPTEITHDIPSQITAYQAIHDLEQSECSDNAKYKSIPSSPFAKWARNDIPIEEYLQIISKKNLNLFGAY